MSTWRASDLRVGHHTIHGDADLTGSDLRGVSLFDSEPYDRGVASVVLCGGVPTFTNTDLRGATIHGHWHGASFVRVKGAQTTWSSGQVRECKFDAAGLVESTWLGLHFEKCSFGGADFSRAVLQHVVFDRCTLRGASLRRVVNRQMPGPEPTPLIFAKSDLFGADLSGLVSDTFGCDECFADSCDLSRARLEHSSFVASSLRHATFDGADLSGARFDRAKLSGASFQGANLRGSSFGSADLTGADLTDATFEDHDLAGAVLDGVRGVDALRLAKIVNSWS